MEELHIKNNQLSRSFSIKTLATEMVMNAQENQLNSIAVVHSKPHATIKLRGSGVTSVVDENGREQDMKRFPE